MKLLHGSNVDVIHPDLMECHDGNDFGKGFYLTDNPLRAVLMAKRKKLLRHKGGIFVSKFSFSLKDAEKSGLKILRFKNFTVEWARFILQNRPGCCGPRVRHSDRPGCRFNRRQHN